jgi:hypothetical protein
MNSDIPVTARDVDDVDVAVHVDNLTSVSLVHDIKSGSTADVAATDQGGNLISEGDVFVSDLHQHANVSVLLNVSVPKTIDESSNTDIDEGLSEEEGSAFIPTRRHVSNMHDSASDSIQHDHPPVYSYGQDEVEIIRLNHESVTLKSGGNNLPQHTSPDANRLNNEVKDIPSFDAGNTGDQDSEDGTGRAENGKGTTRKSLITTTYISAIQSDATTMQYRDESKSGFPVFHTSVEAPSQPKILETDVDNSATEHNSQSVVKHVSPEHGSRLILHSASKSVLNSHAEVPHNNANVSTSLTALQKVSVLELTPDVNGSSRHAKRVLVNVTIATEDADQSNETGYHLSNHQPVYVLSVSVPTSGDSEQVAGVDISPTSQKVASALLGLSNENGTQTLIPKHEQPPPVSSLPPTTTTITHPPPTTAFQFWGGVCECSCPCLDNSENETGSDFESDNLMSTSTDRSIFTENVTVPTTQQGNLTGQVKQIDDIVLISETVTIIEDPSSTSEMLATEPDQISTVSSDITMTDIPVKRTETTILETSPSPDFTFSSPSEYIDKSSNAEVLINSSPSSTLENVSPSISDGMADVSAGFTSTESNWQDCPVAPTVAPPTPLILVIEGKT